jgi:rhodanese-related sulfurtransferase
MQKSIFIIIVCVVVFSIAYFVWVLPNGDIEVVETTISETVKDEVEEIKMTSYQTITPDDTLSKLENGAFLIDVRTKEEFATGHIAQSILIPVDEIKDEVSAIVPDKTATIIVYCRSGNRSKRAAYDLIELGYENVFDLGGIISWPYETEQ